MAYGEAEHGCAQGEPCRPGPHEQPAVAKHHRRLTGFTHPVEPAPGRLPERPEEDVLPARPRTAEPGLPRPRGAEPGVPGSRGAESVVPGPGGVELGVSLSFAAEPGAPPSPTADSPAAQSEPTACRSQIPGWAGAHRHGPVRPAHRNVRQERPPRRWC